jgi:hypothetical protein
MLELYNAQQFVGAKSRIMGDQRGQAVFFALGRGDSFNLRIRITPRGKTGFQLAFHNLKLDTQMHLDGLAVKIKSFPGNQPGPIGKVPLCLFSAHTLKISLLMLPEIVGKSLERLFVSPCRTDTVDPAVIAVVMSSPAKKKLVRYCVFCLRTG